MKKTIYKLWVNIFPTIRGARISLFYNLFYSHVSIGRFLRVKKGCRLSFIPNCRINIGRNVLLGNNNSVKASRGALLEIDNNVGIGDNCQIVCHKHIKIGKATSIGPNVMLFDHNHKFDVGGVFQREFDDGKIIIGEHCWLGAGVIIVKDVTIGNNTIIGAGSVVVKDIPDNSVAVGNPCKPIKYLK